MVVLKDLGNIDGLPSLRKLVDMEDVALLNVSTDVLRLIL